MVDLPKTVLSWILFCDFFVLCTSVLWQLFFLQKLSFKLRFHSSTVCVDWEMLLYLFQDQVFLKDQIFLKLDWAFLLEYTFEINLEEPLESAKLTTNFSALFVLCTGQTSFLCSLSSYRRPGLSSSGSRGWHRRSLEGILSTPVQKSLRLVFFHFYCFTLFLLVPHLEGRHHVTFFSFFLWP